MLLILIYACFDISILRNFVHFDICNMLKVVTASDMKKWIFFIQFYVNWLSRTYWRYFSQHHIKPYIKYLYIFAPPSNQWAGKLFTCDTDVIGWLAVAASANLWHTVSNFPALWFVDPTKKYKYLIFGLIWCCEKHRQYVQDSQFT